MTLRTRIAYQIIDSTWLALGLSLGVTLGLFFTLLPITISGSLNSVLGLILIMAASAVVQFYLYRTQAKYKAWTRVPQLLCEINEIYRHVLSNLYLAGEDKRHDDEFYIAIEKEILDGVCQKISGIFRLITGGAACRTIVYLLVNDEDGIDESSRRFCFTWATSELPRKRDKVQEKRYPLEPGQNTRFIEILDALDKGDEPGFFSADITKETKYHDSLPGFEGHYGSIMVVPIYCAIPTEQDPTITSIRILGFLSVDSSRNRLKEKTAKNLLLAFANQMFNFISLMRHEYRMQASTVAERGERQEVPADSIQR